MSLGRERRAKERKREFKLESFVSPSKSNYKRLRVMYSRERERERERERLQLRLVNHIANEQ